MLRLGLTEKSVCLKPRFYPAYQFISTQKAMKFGGIMTERYSTDESGVGVLSFPKGNMQRYMSTDLGKSHSKHRFPRASRPD